MGHKQATVIIQIHLLSTSRTSQERTHKESFWRKRFYIKKFQTLGPGKKKLDMLHLSEKNTSGIFPAHLFPHLQHHRNRSPKPRNHKFKFCALSSRLRRSSAAKKNCCCKMRGAPIYDRRNGRKQMGNWGYNPIYRGYNNHNL